MKNNSEPAFPTNSKFDPMNGYLIAGGLSIRDYFAAKAMQGALAGSSPITRGNNLAQEAYFIADSMLLEREK